VDYLQRAQALGPTIKNASREIEGIKDLPSQVFDGLVEHDMFRLVQPRDYGGAELAPPDFMRVIEEVAKNDASTAWCLCQNNVCALVSAYLQPETARAIFDSPTGILAWGPGPGTATVTDGGFVLNGQFSFASGSRHATYLGAHVPIVESDGQTRMAENGRPRIITLLFPRTSAKVEDTWQVIGLKGTGSDSFKVKDLFVPEDFSVFRSHTSKKYVDGPLYAFSQSNLYSTGFASLALGLARATMTDFIDIVRDTVPRGAPKPRSQNNVVQSQVGQAEARIRSCRAFLRTSLETIWDDVQRTRQVTEEQQVTIRLATTWAIQQSREVISSLYLTAGALAIFESQPFERRFRDIHTVCQQIQGHAAHFETVGQILMGMEPDRSMFTF
jgi:alkylation response protein AidB-like acyl-CoA dehydrogenase